MTKILRFLLTLVILGGLGLYLLKRNQQFLPLSWFPTSIKSLLNLTENQDLGQVLGVNSEDNTADKLKINPDSLATSLQHTQQGIDQAKSFFQGLIQVDKSKGKNLTDRTVKYATYVYCKQVVDEWEK